ncbi:hypothetical protein ACFX1R_042463 [Malus domestica]
MSNHEGKLSFLIPIENGRMRTDKFHETSVFYLQLGRILEVRHPFIPLVCLNLVNSPIQANQQRQPKGAGNWESEVNLLVGFKAPQLYEIVLVSDEPESRYYLVFTW